MGWIISLVIGGVIGWLASLVMKTNAQMGLIANVLVGVVGSTLGYFVAGLLGLGASNPLGGYLISLAGAVLLIAILKAAGIFK